MKEPTTMRDRVNEILYAICATLLSKVDSLNAMLACAEKPVITVQ